VAYALGNDGDLAWRNEAGFELADLLVDDLDSVYTHLGKNPGLKVRLIHGEEDYQCPYEFAVKFDAALAEAGYDTAPTPFDGGHWLPAQLTVEEIMKVVEE